MTIPCYFYSELASENRNQFYTFVEYEFVIKHLILEILLCLKLHLLT